MIDLAADVSAIFDDVLAVDASYTPVGGQAVAVRVIPSQGDGEMEFNGGALRVPANMFQMPVASAVSLAEGDTLLIDAVTYVVMGAPKRDARRLIWTFEARVSS
ncbi:head-tail joining protein [Roseovarius indicus]|uniref:head-tail joining protein n=1 Tax=Roseovarius indicus TaxID=540747 RepID=UPI0007D96378|nr:hypothetical protein [Roseovarius indicus]OAO02711.1 hypothetical protein A8B76_05050 [Roseovarius indicus]